jgi:pyridoxamine 5'-phosphate oxidase
VLLKGFSEEGFVFFTNYESRKGRDLTAHPVAALGFYWDPLNRQIRIEGAVEKISREDSQAYFSSRPRGSQIGAWASAQSHEIDSREELEEKVRAAEERFAATEIVPVPDYWGGYRLTPDTFEFWQGRANRLHDRFVYRREGECWRQSRLAP